MSMVLKRTSLVALAAALVFAAFPMTSAFAQDENPPKGELTDAKLEKAWARQLKVYERLGKGFENTDTYVAKVQGRIDKAAANGKDVSALQAALDAFEVAMNSARPAYESAQTIFNAHTGFDETGQVTDHEQAAATVKEMRAKMQEIKSAMNGTGKALRAAWKAFREANKPKDTATERDS